MEETRLFERFSIPAAAEYEVSCRPRIIGNSDIKNIGGGGICLILSEKLVPDMRLDIRIKIPGQSKKEEFNLKGRIIWRRIIETEGDGTHHPVYETGIQFLDVNLIDVGSIVSHFYQTAS